MKNQPYQISYRFSTEGSHPTPCQLMAVITLDGEPREYFVQWCTGKGFRPIGAIPNKLAVERAVKRLTDWYYEWDKSNLQQVQIEHQNSYYGNDVYFCIRRTVIRWNGFTWDSNESREYNDPSSHGCNDCSLQRTLCWIPEDASCEVDHAIVMESEELEEVDNGLMDQLLKEVGKGGV
jgi:hypothetical protein